VSEIKPDTPVVFEDRDGFPHWGVALSSVIASGPWPIVLVRVGKTQVRVPARDVAIWLPGVAVLQARAATS